MICKECFEKKYGELSELFYKLSDEEDICFVCGEKKQLVEKHYPIRNENSHLTFY